MDSQFHICSCFFTNNYFLKAYNAHIRFVSPEQVKSEYCSLLTSRGCNTEVQWDEVIKELEKEYARRKGLDDDCKLRKETILKQYVPLHPEVYNLQEQFLTPEFLHIAQEFKKNPSSVTRDHLIDLFQDIHSAKELYSLPVFTQEFCSKFIEEVIHFEKSPCPKGRPNTMNNYGILLNELGMDDLFTRLREDYLQPICRVLFPDWVGESGLDSHKVFTVTYKMGEDRDLAFHFDNAEVTLNFCLGNNFCGGNLYFGNMSENPIDSTTWTQIENKPLLGIVHRGRQRHGAAPITSGERYNLILWMRSSSIRRNLCPMCNKTPTLVPGEGFADGFKKSSTSHCLDDLRETN